MYLVSAFQHSIYLELVIIDLEQNGIAKESILALPLDKRSEHVTVVRETHREGHSTFDLAFILAMLGMLLGAIYGFVFTWGPIIWGLIGMVGGSLIGWLIQFILSGTQLFKRSPLVDVILIVDCKDSQAENVEKILWTHQALGVAKHSNAPAEVNRPAPQR